MANEIGKPADEVIAATHGRRAIDNLRDLKPKLRRLTNEQMEPHVEDVRIFPPSSSELRAGMMEPRGGGVTGADLHLTERSSRSASCARQTSSPRRCARTAVLRRGRAGGDRTSAVAGRRPAARTPSSLPSADSTLA